MLNAEEARARLESLADAEWRATAERRAAKVSRRLRKLTRKLLDGPPAYTGMETWDDYCRRYYLPVSAEVDALSAPDRLEVMAALHPQLGPALARWWVDARDQPYTAGYARRAFRAPGDFTATAVGRLADLHHTVEAAGPYPYDAAWVAAWAPHLANLPGIANQQFAGRASGPLLAAAIDGGDDAVLDALLAVGRGEHPVGVMGRHVIVALLRCSRPEGWEFVERLLLAAQRQEGLRQSILEVADEGHPAAFDRILDIVLEHDLLRFAATIRAAGVWLGFPADVEHIPDARRRLEDLRRFRQDAGARQSALAGDDAWPTYGALCAMGMTDVAPALRAAATVLADRGPDCRAAALRFAAATQVPAAVALAWPVVDDEDLRVAWLAAGVVRHRPDPPPDAYERLERLATRLPSKPRSLDPVGIDEDPVALARAPVVSDLTFRRRDKPLSELLRWLPDMDPATRGGLAWSIGGAGRQALTADLRATLLALVGDRSATVRQAAVQALAMLHVRPDDAPPLEALLTRKAGDLRRGVIGLLAAMPEADVVRSAERLWAGDTAQRDAACELLRELGKRPAATEAATRFTTSPLTARQAELLAPLVGAPPDASAFADDAGLGLYDPSRRAPIPKPADPVRSTFVSPTAVEIAGAFDRLAEQIRDMPVDINTWQGTERVLLADVTHLPSPFTHTGAEMVLSELFLRVWDERKDDLRDAGDDLDALRALVVVLVRYWTRDQSDRNENGAWWRALLDRLGGGPVGEVRHHHLLVHELTWLVARHASTAMVEECLDALAATAAGVPAAAVDVLAESENHPGWNRDFRHLMHGHPWLVVLRGLFALHPELFGPDQTRRWFQLSRWFDEPRPKAHRQLVDPRLVHHAFALGVATEDDLLDMLLQSHNRQLTNMTRLRRADIAARHPQALAVADRLRRRILDIELARGELATSASSLALAVGSISGTADVVRLLAGLGRSGLVRGYIGNNQGREAVYSHLLRVSHPQPEETGAALQAAASAAGVSDQRLLELAVFAPQWAVVVEDALSWPGLAEAVWWFHAHTKDEHWSVSGEVRETWAAMSAERTPLLADDLVAGAVDVAWFHHSRATLGEARWKKLHAAAKLASGGNGHRRAQLFAEAMAGEVTEEALVERIKAKRHQDSVRALGLVPLPADPDATMLRRYATLREFERGARQFGSQRQASEKTAVRIGVENLARTAGMPDPQRFVWAMEAAEAGDLGDGPVTVVDGDAVVTLSVDAEGLPSVNVERNGRPLKALPPKVKKNPDVAALVDRRNALIRQASRVRASLEAAMVNQDPFTAEDLAALDRHPVVAPMLGLVVFVDEAGATVRRTRTGRFADATGEVVSPGGALRLAHPFDLLGAGEWAAWQQQLVTDADRQPFKQVFRELYVLTDTERAAGPASHRYEGHQVQPRQAAALLGSRGWLIDRESGEVARVFHAHRIAARLEFLDGFLTPAEVELPTVKGVYFTKRGQWVAESLGTVPPVVFSEAMRDVDLVVSVAHAGGVDPEASQSTVEMRAALVRETARTLRLDNVRDVGTHVVIAGALGEYSVHLGSGVVHRRPGGEICIIPVDSQRRGRIFLPFADDDPKTAEVVAKVLLLARDREIQDPTILSQLRS